MHMLPCADGGPCLPPLQTPTDRQMDRQHFTGNRQQPSIRSGLRLAQPHPGLSPQGSTGGSPQHLQGRKPGCCPEAGSRPHSSPQPSPFIKRRGDSTFHWTCPAATARPATAQDTLGPRLQSCPACWASTRSLVHLHSGPESPVRGSQVPRAGVAVVVEFLLHVHHVPSRLLEGPVWPSAQLPKAAQLGQPGPRAICWGDRAVRCQVVWVSPMAGTRHSP